MKLVVDANVLVGEVLRQRGRALLRHPDLRIYSAEQVLGETRYELRRRLMAMVSQSKLTEVTERELLELVNHTIDNYITSLALSFYSSWETEARKRIPRDPDDWHTIALALALNAAIWTQDYDFFGCGCPVWTTETLLLQIESF